MSEMPSNASGGAGRAGARGRAGAGIGMKSGMGNRRGRSQTYPKRIPNAFKLHSRLLRISPTPPCFHPSRHIGDIADRVSTTAAADTVDIVNIIHILDFVYFLVVSMPYVD